MLSFLMQSLTIWARTRNLLGMRVGLLDLGNWMLETNLFESFAKELVKNGPSAIWTQAALLGTWYWNLWMAHKAQQHAFSPSRTVPYIMLSQILPITFTACLFIIQLHLDAIGLTPDGTSNEALKVGDQPKTAQNQPLIKKSSLALPTILLNASLLALPSLKSHPVFIPLVLFTRLVLLVPHAGRIGLREKDVLQSISITGGFVVANFAMLRNVVGWRDVVKGLNNGSPALKTLGWDAELGTFMCAILDWGGGV
ncbi:hypothetical protein N0V90_004289 [Kalmusia sp. IMI 367209]|nr:hypothetical protein N0V90_004289 [Kalmusia sp. IMI 367209]